MAAPVVRSTTPSRMPRVARRTLYWIIAPAPASPSHTRREPDVPGLVVVVVDRVGALDAEREAPAGDAAQPAAERVRVDVREVGRLEVRELVADAVLQVV